MKYFFQLMVLACLAVANGDELKPVTCGSVIKITHIESGSDGSPNHYLSSEPKNLGSGSGQQIVTWISDKSEGSGLWWVRMATAMEEECPPATPIACGETIRLTHLQTMRNLHTHAVNSPLSRQQEISAFGQGDGKGDGGDDWVLECSSGAKAKSADGKKDLWTREKKFRLRHVDTGKYLAGSSNVKFTQQNCGHSCPILHHMEAFGRRQVDAFSELKVELGIHLA